MNKNNSERGAMSVLGWFILILIGFWVLWYFTGGPQNPDVNNGPFLQHTPANTNAVQ